MPKRVLDGEGLWRSDKLAQVQPANRRAEYANLIPLALANGTFEAGSRRVWSTVYSYNRPDVTEADVASLLDEFARVKLLFRWKDAKTGKTWGYWTGINKPGRLPGKSRWGTNEAIGPEPPERELQEFTESIGIQNIPSGNAKLPGSGFGSGLGSGSGEGSLQPLAAACSKCNGSGTWHSRGHPGNFLYCGCHAGEALQQSETASRAGAVATRLVYPAFGYSQQMSSGNATSRSSNAPRMAKSQRRSSAK